MATEPRRSHSTRQSSPMDGRAGRTPVGGGGILQKGPAWRTGRMTAWRLLAVDVRERRPTGDAVRALQAAQERLLVGVRGRGESSSLGVVTGELKRGLRPRKVSRKTAWLGMISMDMPRILREEEESLRLLERDEEGEELRKERGIVMVVVETV